MKNHPIGKRIALGFTVSCLLTVFSGVFAAYVLIELKSESQGVAQKNRAAMEIISNLRSNLEENQTNRALLMLSDNEQEQTSLRHTIEDLEKINDALLNRYDREGLATRENQSEFGQLNTSYANYQHTCRKWDGLIRASYSATNAQFFTHELAKAFAEMIQTAQSLYESDQKLLMTETNRYDEKLNRLIIQIISVTSVSLILALYDSVSITRKVNSSLSQIAQELGADANHILSASNELTAASDTLSNGAGLSAAAIEETSANIEELSGIFRQNLESVTTGKKKTAQTRQEAEEGTQDVAEMGKVIVSMDESGQKLDEAMGEIKKSSDAISKIIKTIDEIAFQTNILALNAAVEAARAGEAGLGFAVVADEVRNLARRSAEAAQETENLIESAIKKSSHGVEISQKVASNLKEIGTTSQKVEQRFQGIVQLLRELDEIINHLSEASQQQSQGIVQITQNMHQVDSVTQTNASISEQTAAASQEMHAQAELMHRSVQELYLLVGSQVKPSISSLPPSGFNGDSNRH